MKKLLKILAWIIIVPIAFALLMVLTLPLWLGPVVRPLAKTAVPQITGTDFELEHLSLNPYTGRFEMRGFKLGNPKGYKEPVAVSLSNVVFDVAMSTLSDKYIHIEEITVEDVFVSYVDGGEHDVDNFTQMQYNAAGGKEKYEAKKKKAELKKAKAEEEAKKKAEVESNDEDDDDDVSKQKFVIDRLAIRRVSVKYGLITIPVPVDIVLTDIGKESEGATFTEVMNEIWKSILKAAGAVGDGVKAIGGLIGDGASKTADAVGEGAKKTTEAVKNLLNF